VSGDDQELPDSGEIDSGWDLGDPGQQEDLRIDEPTDEEDADSTRPFDAHDLLGSPHAKPTLPRMRAVRSPRPPPAYDELDDIGELGESDSTSAPPDERRTLPPPVPATEYLARMMSEVPEPVERELPHRDALMGVRKPSLAERHRAIFESLRQEDPAHFGPGSTRNPVAPSSQPGSSPRAPLSSQPSSSARVPGATGSAPPSVRRPASLAPAEMSQHQIEDLRLYFRSKGVTDRPAAPDAPPTLDTGDIDLDNLDNDLFQHLPPPPGSGSVIDELDELPVDELLKSPSLAPYQADIALLEHAFEEEETTAVAPLKPVPPASIPPTGLRLDHEPQPQRREPPPPFDDGDESVNERLTLTGFESSNRLELIQNRFVVGDFSGALVVAESVLEEDPSNDVARRYAESCRDMLRQMYLAQIGDGGQIPRVLTSPERLVGLTLDHRAGFVLACVDGMSSIDEILDVSGMPVLDALRIMYELAQEGIILVEDRAPVLRRR
jgi:hypothetical protein